MLADDVRLDLVSQRKAAGRREVGNYFTNYDRAGGWHWFQGGSTAAKCWPYCPIRTHALALLHRTGCRTAA